MKKISNVLVVTLLAVLCLSSYAYAELREPARENMEKVREFGYDLDSMPTKIVKFDKDLVFVFDESKDDIGDEGWELWYVDETYGLENFAKEPAYAKTVALQKAVFGEENWAYEVYRKHDDVPGILCAGVGGLIDGEPDISYTYIDPLKEETVDNYDHTLVTFYGDCNLDGVLDLKDVLSLRKQLASILSNAFDDALLDVNRDKIIDMKDVLQLRKQIAGLNETSVHVGYEFDVCSF